MSKKKSPTAAVRDFLEASGYEVGNVQKYIAAIKRFQDLFGFCDLVAVGETELLFVQVTSSAHYADRKAKVEVNRVAQRIARIPQAHVWVCGTRYGKREESGVLFLRIGELLPKTGDNNYEWTERVIAVRSQIVAV